VLALGGGTSWRSEPPLPLARSEVAAATVRGEIAIVGGFLDGGGSSARVDLYSPQSRSWRRLPDLPVTVNHALASAYLGRLYVAGGYGPAGRIRQAWVLDRGRWRALPPLPYGLAAGGAAFLGGTLYLVGGVAGAPDRSVLVRRMLVLDPARPGGWRFAPAPSPREHLAVAVDGGRIYAIGGRTAGFDTNLSLVESWRPGERAWRKEPPVPEPRGGTGAAAIGKTFVSAGGEAPAGTIAGVYAFDTTSRTWRKLPDLPTPRHGLGVAAAGGRVYVIGGGRTPGLAVSDVAESLAVG
jgi:non-specific serine/threonine protein kinase